MKLYNIDYTLISEQDKHIWERILEEEKIKRGDLTVRKNYYRKYPKAARHYMSLFPNNLLDIVELGNKEELNDKIEEFKNILNDDKTSELDILRYIRDTESYFIIGSILKNNYNFGHHSAYVFKEFMLGTSYKADYLLIGRNSGGYEMVFVELENPKGNITIKGGELGKTFRDGIKQVTDWEAWLDSNFTNLREVFSKYKSTTEQLPDEFINYDTSRIHYVVVAGMRTDFNDKTYSIKRRHKERQKITLLHYNNLIDGALSVVGEPTY